MTCSPCGPRSWRQAARPARPVSPGPISPGWAASAGSCARRAGGCIPGPDVVVHQLVQRGHPAAVRRPAGCRRGTQRRDTFLDAAQHLVQTKGYERMTVQDVLDDVGTSEGALSPSGSW